MFVDAGDQQFVHGGFGRFGVGGRFGLASRCSLVSGPRPCQRCGGTELLIGCIWDAPDVVFLPVSIRSRCI